MRKLISLLAIFFCYCAFSQEITHTGLEVQIDTNYVGRGIFDIMPTNVEINQSEDIQNALIQKVSDNSEKLFSGFRIRIFLDSRPGAREQSSEAILRFNERYPYINADRSYIAPNFKVSVGNFRTRLEAESFLKQIKGSFPDAFIVREQFKYPTIGSPDTRVIESEEVQ